jgi:stage II sporulation protein AA (anti-sigma F factor antagonist)
MEITQEGKTVTVLLTGEIDHHTAKGLRQAADDALITRRPEELVLDFSGVTFMDSSGVGLVMGRYKAARSLGCGVTVKGLRPRDAKIMRLSGLSALVTFI